MHRTPIEETLEALHDVVKAGKARSAVATTRGVPRAQVALALRLTAEECAALEAPYVPHPVSGI